MPKINEYETVEFNMDSLCSWAMDETNDHDFDEFLEYGELRKKPILDGLTLKQYAKEHNITFDWDFHMLEDVCRGLMSSVVEPWVIVDPDPYPESESDEEEAMDSTQSVYNNPFLEEEEEDSD